MGIPVRDGSAVGWVWLAPALTWSGEPNSFDDPMVTSKPTHAVRDIAATAETTSVLGFMMFRPFFVSSISETK